MSNSSTLWRFCAACGVLSLVAALCLCVVIAGAIALNKINPSEIIPFLPATSTSVVEATTAPETNPTPSSRRATPTPVTDSSEPTATTTTGDEKPTEMPSLELPADVAEQMDEIQQQVVTLRGLQPGGTFNRGLLSREQLHENVVNDFFEDYTEEESRDDGISLAAFGLLETDFDIRGYYMDLLSEQVAGYYDDITKEMYVVQGNGFLGPERLTYSHEYNHALQDQNYGLEDGLGLSDEECDKDSERCAAVQALIEGDSTLLEMQWFTKYATQDDYQQLLDFYNTFESPILDNAPGVIREDLLFPYTQGMEFVQHLYDQGKWDAVDQAYANLPVSTEQILHPERYPDDQPLSVTLPDFSAILGDGWREADRGVNGEWYTYLLLTQGIDPATQLDTDQAETAAEGWGGDAYAVYYNDQQQTTVLVLSTEWDTQTDADEFAAAFQEYASARFGASETLDDDSFSWSGSDSYAEFHQDGSSTIWILAPDATTAQAIWGSLQK